MQRCDQGAWIVFLNVVAGLFDPRPGTVLEERRTARGGFITEDPAARPSCHQHGTTDVRSQCRELGELAENVVVVVRTPAVDLPS